MQSFSTLNEKVDFLIVDTATAVKPLTLSLVTASPKRFKVVRDNLAAFRQTIACIKTRFHDHDLGEIYLLIHGVVAPQDGQRLFDRIYQACCALTIDQCIL